MELEAAIFDMDGVLLDSEPFWQDAEMEVFGRLGLVLTRDDCRQTMGMRIDQVVARRHAEHPWDGPGLDEVAEAVVSRVVELVGERGRLLDGVEPALDRMAAHGLRLALASSSSYRLIQAVLDALGLDGRFELCHSADDEAAGKPDPAVYLTTAAKLGVAPGRCLAVEDSLAGVAAAKAAGMRCLAVPDRTVAAALAAAAAGGPP
ncbi:MAG: hexitol phosphatase HxpB, partial [Acidimicrobiales bacterium]